jgi:hypothetical protein
MRAALGFTLADSMIVSYRTLIRPANLLLRSDEPFRTQVEERPIETTFSFH